MRMSLNQSGLLEPRDLIENHLTGAEGCWERKVRKDEGKCFMMTINHVDLKLEMKGGVKESVFKHMYQL